jgi:hypothetical protein
LETVYDWVTVGIFAGLVVLFLQRSAQEEPQDKLWQYCPPSIGCATANYLGNNGQAIAAYVLLGGILAYILIVLKPFAGWHSDESQ